MAFPLSTHNKTPVGFDRIKHKVWPLGKTRETIYRPCDKDKDGGNIRGVELFGAMLETEIPPRGAMFNILDSFARLFTGKLLPEGTTQTACIFFKCEGHQNPDEVIDKFRMQLKEKDDIATVVSGRGYKQRITLSPEVSDPIAAFETALTSWQQVVMDYKAGRNPLKLGTLVAEVEVAHPVPPEALWAARTSEPSLAERITALVEEVFPEGVKVPPGAHERFAEAVRGLPGMGSVLPGKVLS